MTQRLIGERADISSAAFLGARHATGRRRNPGELGAASKFVRQRDRRRVALFLLASYRGR